MTRSDLSSERFYLFRGILIYLYQFKTLKKEIWGYKKLLTQEDRYVIIKTSRGGNKMKVVEIYLNGKTYTMKSEYDLDDDLALRSVEDGGELEDEVVEYILTHLIDYSFAVVDTED